MKKVNNKNGLKMYWERANDINKINIFDSNGNYFNDLYFDTYENDNGTEDIGAIIHTLEETTLENMCNFFGATLYESTKELLEREHINDFDENTIQENEYVNTFKIKDKTFYTWSW